MIDLTDRREKYIIPLVDVGVASSDMLCESSTGDLEGPEPGDPWSF